MNIEGEYILKKKNAPIHGARIALEFREDAGHAVVWKKSKTSYGKAYSKENKRICELKLKEMGSEYLSVVLNDLIYQEPYKQEQMTLVIEKAIEIALEKLKAEQGSGGNVG